MVDRLIEKTGPAVQLESGAQTKGERTREKILDIAYECIVQKGFAATSIEELVETAGITKSGFFYHFRDKNDMARLHDRERDLSGAAFRRGDHRDEHVLPAPHEEEVR